MFYLVASMAGNILVNFFMYFAFICVYIVESQLTTKECDYTNIEFTSENGNQQIFTVKSVQLSPIPDCSSINQNKVHNVHPDTQHQQKKVTFIPQFQLLYSDLIICGDLKDEDVELLFLCKADAIESIKNTITQGNIQKYASLIVEKSLLPVASGVADIDLKIAEGSILVRLGRPNEAIDLFTDLLKAHSDVAALYYIRGVAYVRKGLNNQEDADRAIRDLEQASKRLPDLYLSLERLAEVYLVLGYNSKALSRIGAAMRLPASKTSAKLYFMRASLHFAQDDLVSAEHDFRHAASLGNFHEALTLYNLGLTLYHRGKFTNAIEVFRDVVRLEPQNIEAITSLAQSYRELGDVRRALLYFNESLGLDGGHLRSLQLLAVLQYQSGEPRRALATTQSCLDVDAHNKMCLYVQGLAHSTMGQYYHAVKAHTKAIVYNREPVMKMSPEILKAHYLREYSRYLHTKLDSPVVHLFTDEHLPGIFRDHWVKLLPFVFNSDSGVEQPGLQPGTDDVGPAHTPFSALPNKTRQIVCVAQKLGDLAQVTVAGFVPSRRHGLAMGLASLHIAQVLYKKWEVEALNRKRYPGLGWRDVFNIAVHYRRLADPEQPVFWLDEMPQSALDDGYNADVAFLRGQTVNTRLTSYFDLVLKLMKTMVGHYQGSGAPAGAPAVALQEELEAATTYDDLLKIAKSGGLGEEPGVRVSTQVPSAWRHLEEDAGNTDSAAGQPLDGAMLTLHARTSGHAWLTIRQATTRARSAAYSAQLDSLYGQMYRELHRNNRPGARRGPDIDALVNLALSLAYYFYNLAPLSRGTASVAYSTLLGFILSLDRDVTGKIPPGKLVDMEAMLAGAPEAFTMVAKHWMKLKKSETHISSYALVKDTFPTVRSVIEVLNSNPVC